MNGLDNRITFTRASSGTYFNSAGVLSTASTDTPRFDYDPVTLAPKGLLIEEARTNVILRSQEFDHAAWSKNAANESVTANATTAPDGALTADKLVETNSNASHRTFQQFTSTVAAWTASVFVKAAEITDVFVGIWDTVNERGSQFNLATGVVTSNETGCVGVIEALPGGWYRCSTTRTLAAADPTASMVIYMTSHGSYVGTTGNGLYLWQADCQLGSFPTSPIATTTASVTRAADVCSITGLDTAAWFNASAMTVALEFDQIATGQSFPHSLKFCDNTDNNRLNFLLHSTANRPRFIVSSGGTDYADIIEGATQVAANAPAKIAGAAQANDAAFAFNGALVGADASVTMPTGIDRLLIGQGISGDTRINGHIRRIRYWRYRLSNNLIRKLSL